MISLVYLFEGKVTEHIKRNWGKYAVGAGVTALAEPELSYGYHKNSASDMADKLSADQTNYKIRDEMELLQHGKKAVDANSRNLLNKKDYVWVNPKSGIADHIKNVQKYDFLRRN